MAMPADLKESVKDKSKVEHSIVGLVEEVKTKKNILESTTPINSDRSDGLILDLYFQAMQLK